MNCHLCVLSFDICHVAGCFMQKRAMNHSHVSCCCRCVCVCSRAPSNFDVCVCVFATSCCRSDPLHSQVMLVSVCVCVCMCVCPDPAGLTHWLIHRLFCSLSWPALLFCRSWLIVHLTFVMRPAACRWFCHEQVGGFLRPACPTCFMAHSQFVCL